MSYEQYDYRGAIRRAIKAVGSAAKLGRVIGCTPSNIFQWKRCPDHRAEAVSNATGGLVSMSDLRPDLWKPKKKKGK